MRFFLQTALGLEPQHPLFPASPACLNTQMARLHLCLSQMLLSLSLYVTLSLSLSLSLSVN